MESINRRFPHTTGIIALAMASGCSIFSPGSDPSEVDITTSAPTLDALGGTVQLGAVVRDQDGTPIPDITISWSAASGAVATVTSGGVVTAVANGTETITARSGDLSDEVTVTVAQVAAAVEQVGGAGQAEEVTVTLPEDLVAQVNDRLGNPIVGADVDFAVTTGGGSVSNASGTTDNDGRVTTTWTLGTAAGTQEMTASVSGDPTVNTVFAATATPGPPDALEMASGDGQLGVIDAPLPDPIVARVVDQYGNGVSGVAVGFVVTSGGGSVNPASGLTDAAGEAATTWTLGSVEGTQDARASSPGLSGSPLDFVATGTMLSFVSVSPDPIVEGQSATLNGTGFNPVPSNNTVTVDGVAATVTLATPTQLTITVPTFDCRPARNIDVTVTVAGQTPPAITHPLAPPSFVNLAVGQQQIVQDPTAFCLQFDANGGTEEYLIGVQNTSEVFSILTPITVRGVVPAGTPTPPAMTVAPARPAGRGLTALLEDPAYRRRQAHRAAETWYRDFDRRTLQDVRAARTAGFVQGGVALMVDSTLQVGDSVNVRVFDRSISPSSCDNFVEIKTFVRAKGTRGMFLEDAANPANGFTATDFQNLSDQFDSEIYDTDVTTFGAPTDRDDNGRVVIVITKEVNRVPNLLGFVISCDLFVRGPGTLGSNDGEFFYGIAPDPNGDVGNTYAVEDARDDAPFVIAHELSHVIQQSRRNAMGANFMVSWLAEGQATLAEEVVGHVVEGRSSGTDLGIEEALNFDDPNSIDWYSNGFVDMVQYFGFVNSTTRQADAPHTCSWLLNTGFGNTDICSGNRKVYGTPWSLLRYITDRFGAAYPGGPNALQSDLIDNTNSGYAVLRDVLGRVTAVTLETVLAQWAATLYIDGRVPGAAAELTMSSWNLVDVFEGIGSGGSFFDTAHLTPAALAFADFTESESVRAASSYYALITGTNRPATAVRARNTGDGILPNHMQMWVVRVQ